MLQVDEDLLERLLCQHMLHAPSAQPGKRESIYLKVHDADQASSARDAIAKAAYDWIFAWIVDRVAAALDRGPASLPFIGVLDIFGFEVFERNDFEQLLINFANEKLQFTFNNAVLIAEQQIYVEEGLQVGEVTCECCRRFESLAEFSFHFHIFSCFACLP